MSEKVYVRKVETWTISAGSEPIEVNVEALRNCEPPYEGESDEDLATYFGRMYSTTMIGMTTIPIRKSMVKMLPMT